LDAGLLQEGVIEVFVSLLRVETRAALG